MVIDLGAHVLDEYLNATEWKVGDAGPAVLAGLLFKYKHLDRLCTAAVDKWLSNIEHLGNNPNAHLGMFGYGLAGYLMGVTYLNTCWNFQLEQLRQQLEQIYLKLINERDESLKNDPWIGWHNYDLVTGRSASVLALCGSDIEIDGYKADLEELFAVANDVEKIRVNIYNEDPLRSWNVNRINTGLAHGAAGVIASLAAVYRNQPELRSALRTPLKTLCEWMISEAYRDKAGLITWSVAAREGREIPIEVSTRQAWCYGTPGIAWSLYSAGSACEDRYVMNFAVDSLLSFCNAFSEKYVDETSISSQLAMCHGIAGIGAITNAFSKSSGREEFDDLTGLIEGMLLGKREEIVNLAKEDASLLTGATGIVAAMIAIICSDVDRRFLTQFALR